MCRTFRITGRGVDVDERSERATLFPLRFIRLFVGTFGGRGGFEFRTILIREYVGVDVNRSIHVRKERKHPV
jgi:hypothetical protein